MRKEYSDKEMKRILQQKIDVPDLVDDGIRKAYGELGLSTNGRRRHYVKRHRIWTAIAAAAVLTVGFSVTAFAVNYILNVNIQENGETLKYYIEVDKTQKEAHKIETKPSYLPEGYVSDGSGIKWHNDETDGGISIIPLNAAELYTMSQIQENTFREYKKDELKENLQLNDSKMDLFVSDGFYVDSEKTVKEIYLFHEEYGYAVHIFSESDLSTEEMKKVAEGVEVTVLDETVPYPTDEEIAKMKMDLETENEKWQREIPVGSLVSVGETVKDPLEAYQPDRTEDLIRMTVESVEVKDSLMLQEYPKEQFVWDYDSFVAPWLNADGTLKPHERYVFEGVDMRLGSEKAVETTGAKYVVVKMKTENQGEQSDFNLQEGVYIAPRIDYLTEEDGLLKQPEKEYSFANKSYRLEVDGMPIYFDKLYYQDNYKKHALFHPIAKGEALEYTLIYVVDEDRLDQAYLNLFYGDEVNLEEGDYYPRLKVTG